MTRGERVMTVLLAAAVIALWIAGVAMAQTEPPVEPDPAEPALEAPPVVEVPAPADPADPAEPALEAPAVEEPEQPQPPRGAQGRGQGGADDPVQASTPEPAPEPADGESARRASEPAGDSDDQGDAQGGTLLGAPLGDASGCSDYRYRDDAIAVYLEALGGAQGDVDLVCPDLPLRFGEDPDDPGLDGGDPTAAPGVALERRTADGSTEWGCPAGHLEVDVDGDGEITAEDDCELALTGDDLLAKAGWASVLVTSGSGIVWIVRRRLIPELMR